MGVSFEKRRESKIPVSKKKCYVHNIFTTISQQILSGSLLLAVFGWQKCNFSCRFKLEPITTKYL